MFNIPSEKQEIPKSKTQQRTLIILSIIDKGTTLLSQAVKYGAWIAIAYVGVLAVRELAGKTTVASFLLSYFTGESENHAPIAWMIATGLFALWAMVERWIRLRKVRSMSARIESLELRFDPQRTSSGLTKSGETPVSERTI